MTAMRRAFTIEDFRALAERRLPRGLFEFIDRGSEQSLAVARNRAALDRLTLMPRAMVDVSMRSSVIELLGQRCALPLCIAPTGAAGLVWYQGDLALARAAASAGIAFSAATGSTSSLEQIAEAAGANRWFQLYMGPDTTATHALIDRVRGSGYHALVLTADTPVTPSRAHNARNGFSFPLSVNRRSVVDLATHPQWLLGVMGRHLAAGRMPRHENLAGADRPKVTAGAVFNPKSDAVDWAIFADLRRRWTGPILIKGLLHPDDAARAMQEGADGIIVSNHGGRNFDSAPASLDALPAIADRIEQRVPILFDGGILFGSDIAKAVALGADAAMIGRAALWGLAAGGEAGVRGVIEFLKADFDRTLAFTGSLRPADLPAAARYPCVDRRAVA